MAVTLETGTGAKVVKRRLENYTVFTPEGGPDSITAVFRKSMIIDGVVVTQTEEQVFTATGAELAALFPPATTITNFNQYYAATKKMLANLYNAKNPQAAVPQE